MYLRFWLHSFDNQKSMIKIIFEKNIFDSLDEMKSFFLENKNHPKKISES